MTHSRGMAATSVARWRVTPISRSDGPAAIAAHRGEIDRPGGAAVSPSLSARPGIGPRPPGQPGADGEEHQEAEVGRRPPGPLVLDAEHPLDHQRVGEQPDEAAGVAGGVEDVGVGRGEGQPYHRWRVGDTQARARNGADGGGDRQHGPHGRIRRRGPPAVAQPDREGHRGGHDEQHRRGRVPAGGEPGRAQVGEQVAAEQQTWKVSIAEFHTGALPPSTGSKVRATSGSTTKISPDATKAVRRTAR